MINNASIANTLKGFKKFTMLCIQEKSYTEALNLLDTTLQIKKTLKFTWEVAQTLINIANVYYCMGEYETALGKPNQAESTLDGTRDANTQFNIENMKGTIQYQLKNYLAALTHFNKCYRLPIDRGKQARCHFQLASTCYKNDNHSAAMKHVQAAMGMFSSLNDTRALIESRELWQKIRTQQNHLPL